MAISRCSGRGFKYCVVKICELAAKSSETETTRELEKLNPRIRGKKKSAVKKPHCQREKNSA